MGHTIKVRLKSASRIRLLAGMLKYLFCRYKIFSFALVYWITIRQKGESQNGGYKKTKHSKFPKKLIFLTSRIRKRKHTTKI